MFLPDFFYSHLYSFIDIIEIIIYVIRQRYLKPFSFLFCFPDQLVHSLYLLNGIIWVELMMKMMAYLEMKYLLMKVVDGLGKIDVGTLIKMGLLRSSLNCLAIY
jgi:hypothetical protein